MRDHPTVKRPLLHVPFPDALEPGYVVMPGTGGINFSGKLMHVPVGESDYDRFVRLHEMGHLTWTPKHDPHKVMAKHGISEDALQVCEDARINTLLTRAKGLPMRRLGATEDLEPWRRKLSALVVKDKREALREAVMARVAFTCRAGDEMETLLNAVGLPEANEMAREVVRQLKWTPKRLISFASTIKAAKLLDALLATEDIIDDSPADLGKIVKARRGPHGAPRGKFVRWGKLGMQYPPLSARHMKSCGVIRRATDTGTRLRSVSRLLTDRKIFSQKVRSHGGSLLIDGSGSMSLSPVQIQQILEMAPVAWIGVYGANSQEGWIKVLAANGKCCAPDDMHSPGGCNVVDGPALEVLAKQARPRLWICDGVVTGVGDRYAEGNAVACAKICLEHNIRRLGTMSAAIDYLKTLTRPK